jgi:hypothetical protein
MKLKFFEVEYPRQKAECEAQMEGDGFSPRKYALSRWRGRALRLKLYH